MDRLTDGRTLASHERSVNLSHTRCGVFLTEPRGTCLLDSSIPPRSLLITSSLLRIRSFFAPTSSLSRNEEAPPRRHSDDLSQTPKSRLHPDRAAGGDRDHRHPDRSAAPGRAEGPRGRRPHEVLQQPQADGPRPSQPPRYPERLPNGLDNGNPRSRGHDGILGLGGSHSALPGAIAALQSSCLPRRERSRPSSRLSPRCCKRPSRCTCARPTP